MTEKISSQMLKGILEGCLLIIIGEKEVYGYEVNQVLKAHEFLEVAEGTIYPLLQKMQKEKWIEGEMRASSDGPMRKYFHLTPLGEEKKNDFQREWTILKNSVEALIGGNEDEK